MGLQKLEEELIKFDKFYKEWPPRLHEMPYETRDYTEIELKKYLATVYRQKIYPLREEILSVYVTGTEEERYYIREIVHERDHLSGMILNYVVECAECLESPEDGWILRSGLVAASINNFLPDFRDTGYALAELAIAAREAGIDIEPHSSFVAELCPPEMPGVMSMRRQMKNFHIYALKAIHLGE